MAMDSAEVRTFIYGSCVSRDTFKYLPERFVLHRYVARQSLISAGNSTTGVKEKLSPLTSPFQQRMVAGDLDGNLYSSLKNAGDAVELILIDLVDERGGVVALGGGYATKLNEFWGAGGREASRGAHLLPFGTDEHFERWSAGAERFVAELRELGLLHRAVVLRADWASTYEDGDAFPVPDWMTPPAEANAAYGRYFDHLSTLGLRIITLPQELAHTSRDHEWGASPFHYQDAAYEYFAQEIQQATALSETQDTGPADRTTRVHLDRRDTAAWGAFTDLQSPSEIAEADLSSGFLTVWQDGLPFDLLVDDIGAETTLVSFHAALGGSGLKPPIFTARTVSDGIGLNRIFVSDPGLLAGEELGLAWYLGTSKVDATKVLVEIITALQERMGAKHLVFFGMSGGGFAALNLSHEFPGSLAVPVNPQTRILDYLEEHWDDLGRQCFGASTAEGSREILEAHPRADLRRVYAEGFENTVIYVQNASDGHVRTQMNPWLEIVGGQAEVSVLLGDWGRGHVPPSARDLKPMLAHLADAHGDWRQIADTWGAAPSPSREDIDEKTAR
ncbi:DUF6270 domain-containing protein [Brachybacterium sp. J144]|uniref:DUF6270 domain-containing protein n=1 Tax=Brachybacterium sp. J144 TaxID=3116487 RepID=UPI002E77424F|nr:DUF6270 domain-containing protein [Brachybacterium sp. J144]MEE1650729.1 DUF6270 domain-containing protein [Brachybacterium sp. J144]